MLPFYPSPLRDDGYDIADYTAINPSYGHMSDFKRLVREAHRRDLNVVTELVINHTSDQHPWFQRARKSKHRSEEQTSELQSLMRTPYAVFRLKKKKKQSTTTYH